MTPEIYVSTDIEADGPIPGPHSMLSLGSAAYLPNKTLVGTFSVNLEVLPDAKPDPKTEKWWRQYPDAWARCRTNTKRPEQAMREYVMWLKGLPGIPVFVGYPAAFDFMFVYWYLIRFTGESPFSHSALDIKSFAMAILGINFRDLTKGRMPSSWIENWSHSHVALEDAVDQGIIFCNMLDEASRSRS